MKKLTAKIYDDGVLYTYMQIQKYQIIIHIDLGWKSVLKNTALSEILNSQIKTKIQRKNPSKFICFIGLEIITANYWSELIFAWNYNIKYKSIMTITSMKKGK